MTQHFAEAGFAPSDAATGQPAPDWMMQEIYEDILVLDRKLSLPSLGARRRQSVEPAIVFRSIRARQSLAG